MAIRSTASRDVDVLLRTLPRSAVIGVAGLGIAFLCYFNFLFHAGFPNVVAWLPAGVSFGLVLLAGYHAVPAVLIGTMAGLAMADVPLQTAGFAGAASAFACAATRWLLQKLGAIDLEQCKVLPVAKMHAGSALIFSIVAFASGPASIALLVGHAAATPSVFVAPHAGATADPALPHSRAYLADTSAPHAPAQTVVDTSVKTHEGGNVDRLGAIDGKVLEEILIDPVGLLLITPLMLWVTRPRQERVQDIKESWRGAVFMLSLLCATTLAIYSGFVEERFGIVHTTLLVLPPAVWLALEYGLIYTLLGNIATFMITGVGTSLGHGPFKDHTAGLPLLSLVFLLTTLLIAASRSERKQAENVIQRMMNYDSLTGAATRDAFSRRMKVALDVASRYQRKFALMFVDLNRFKQINDSHGHEVGDMALAETSRRIMGNLRSDSVLARFGGDEFVILVDHVLDPSALEVIAERVIDTVSQPIFVSGAQCQIGCSIGISVFPDNGATAAELLKKADAAMYVAKATGRSNWHIYALDTMQNEWQDVPPHSTREGD